MAANKSQTLEEAIAERVAPLVAAAVIEHLEDQGSVTSARPQIAPDDETVQGVGWEVLFWNAPANVRIKTDQLLEALGWSRSWLYAHTGPKCPASDRIPHRKGPDNENVFLVGEVRDWWVEREHIVVPGSQAQAALKLMLEA